jgi:VanZ family protein
MIWLFLKQYYKSILIGLLILWLSLTGSSTMVPGRILNIPYIDKLGHLSMYALFSAVLLLDSCHWKTSRGFSYAVLLIPLGFGALMEILQMTLTQARKAEIADLAANIGGVTAGIIAAHIAIKLLDKIKS